MADSEQNTSKPEYEDLDMNPQEEGETPKNPIYSLKQEDFDYTLPESQIAQYPLKERDQAKMLVYDQGSIHHSRFTELPDWLPESSLMVFNDTKVFHARLLFQRETGASIEIFCLEPAEKHREINLVMWDQQSTTWHCMVRNLKKWPEGEVLTRETRINNRKVTLKAELVEKGGEENTVRFQWKPKQFSFATLLEHLGEVPLPPYIDREPEAQDHEAYQTVFAERAGAVAAPTAGLHFTEALLDALRDKGIQEDFLTLHVSAGTFKPVESDNIPEHSMHAEQVLVRWENLVNLKHAEGPIIPVGTTSLRAMESIYWYGVKLLLTEGGREFFIPKLMPYDFNSEELPSTQEALDAVLNEMERRGNHQIAGTTEIFIMPSYQFKLAHGLITNYHMPKSTLIMLVAAFIGKDWQKVYQEALQNNYRFLSYGDGSLLFPKDSGKS